MVTTNSEIAEAPRDNTNTVTSQLLGESAYQKPGSEGGLAGAIKETGDELQKAGASILTGKEGNTVFKETDMANATTPEQKQKADSYVTGHSFNPADVVMSAEQVAKMEEVAHRAASGEGKMKN